MNINEELKRIGLQARNHPTRPGGITIFRIKDGYESTPVAAISEKELFSCDTPEKTLALIYDRIND